MSKRHKHADQIIFWANNTDSNVYFRKEHHVSWNLYRPSTRISWYSDYEYVLVPPRYQHLWEAYLEGKLEYSLDSEWVLIKNNIPNFHFHTTGRYRVKPDPVVDIIVKIDGEPINLKDISKKTLIKAWESVQEK